MYLMDGGHNDIAQEYDFIMPTSENMILQNQIIYSGDTRTFVAQNTIEVAGDGEDFIIEEGSNVEMVAGESIVLKDGFHVSGNFHAYIQDVDCDDVNEKNKTSKQEKNQQIKDNQTEVNDDIIINRQNSVCVFPNPSKGIFTLYFSENTENLNKIQINDITGKTIYFNNEPKISKNNIFVIDISDKKAGIYLLKLKYNNTTYTNKIIIQ